MTEQSRIAIRNIRRDYMDSLKKQEKDGLSEDESKKLGSDVQKKTDEYIEKAGTLLSAKEKDILTI